MKPALSDIILFFGLVLIGAGLYLRLDLGTALAVDGGILLVMGLKMAPKRRE